MIYNYYKYMITRFPGDNEKRFAAIYDNDVMKLSICQLRTKCLFADGLRYALKSYDSIFAHMMHYFWDDICIILLIKPA